MKVEKKFLVTFSLKEVIYRKTRRGCTRRSRTAICAENGVVKPVPRDQTSRSSSLEKSLMTQSTVTIDRALWCVLERGHKLGVVDIAIVIMVLVLQDSVHKLCQLSLFNSI